MPQVLYRQYRPQTFSEVVNQEVIKTTLKNSVNAGALAHAYLFTGPRGVGKTSIARILAKAVNCLRLSEGEPCGKCSNCAQIRDGNFMDLVEIDAASHTGVDNIREIIEHVKFSPSAGKYKVIVIDEVHMLSKGAFNALLKTLEEPPAHAIFILATTEINKVPVTIISRTQRFDFRQLSQADILTQLKLVIRENKFKIPEEALKLLARAAGGSMRDALSLLDQVLSFGSEKISLEEAEEILGLAPFSLNQDFFELLLDKKPAPAVRFVKELAMKGRDLNMFLNGFLEYIEMVLSFQVSGAERESTGLVLEDFEKLELQAARATRGQIVRMADLFLSAFQKIKSSPIPELPLELAAIEFMEADDPQKFSSDANSQKINGSGQTQADLPAENEAAGEVRNEPEISSNLTGSEDDLTAEIVSKWNEFVARVREYNHSLISSLKLATIVASDKKRLLIGFPYRFHKEAVEQRKNKIVIEKVLEETFGRPMKLECCMNHEIDDYKKKFKPAMTGPSLVDEAIKIFGISQS
ncbi:MAG: DNA polymerase III subunit gamma/tau [Patescibacteria group bacterium]